ncbi:hypothetical protein EYZ11_010619 [Aspergillus tanneri]|uniref:Uncharacterized protein n=1 Tax=Aspergillus tanneri TaxID=1220188 RepID=A0A4S3J5F6_9EURO|nr:hypothetical protein EYZ11_010619 [Aspergillus tanneri]
MFAARNSEQGVRRRSESLTNFNGAVQVKADVFYTQVPVGNSEHPVEIPQARKYALAHRRSFNDSPIWPKA